MTTPNTPTDPSPESRSPRVERAIDNLISIGRLWASHGIEMGRSALATSAESLKLAADTLGELKSRVNGEPGEAAKKG